jgi:hypothetical protein
VPAHSIAKSGFVCQCQIGQTTEQLKKFFAMMASLLSALQSWLTFVLSDVLPVAFAQIGHWLYDWQGLAAGVLAIIAAWIWGSSIVRAGRHIAGREDRVSRKPVPSVPQRDRKASNNGIKSKTIETKAGSIQSVAGRVQALRDLIRTTLARLPQTDEPLTPENLADCVKIAGFSLEGVALRAGKVAAARYESLLLELSALSAASKRGTCRSAWEALIGVNKAARELMDAVAE